MLYVCSSPCGRLLIVQACATRVVLDLAHQHLVSGGKKRTCYHTNRLNLEESIVSGAESVAGSGGGGEMVDAAAAAANLEWLGLNLRRMNRGGLNHVTYYEPEKKKEGVRGGWSRGAEI